MMEAPPTTRAIPAMEVKLGRFRERIGLVHRGRVGANHLGGPNRENISASRDGSCGYGSATRPPPDSQRARASVPVTTAVPEPRRVWGGASPRLGLARSDDGRGWARAT